LQTESFFIGQDINSQYSGLIQARKDTQSRAIIDNQNSRTNTASGYEEESKLSRPIPPQVNLSNPNKLATHTYTKSGFGDFYGNTKDFHKPPEDKMSSQYAQKGDDAQKTQSNSFS
jgi:hypothetical protein